MGSNERGNATPDDPAASVRNGKAWVALLDGFGREVQYYGYARQRTGPIDDSWGHIVFSKSQKGDGDVVYKIALCHSETSSVKDADVFDIDPYLIVSHEVTPTVYLRSKP